MTSGEPDFTKRMKGRIDHWFIKGETLKDPTTALCLPVSIEHIVEINHKQILDTALQAPTVAACLPVSIENDAIAYDEVNDRFKVDIEALTVGNLPMNLAEVLGSALAHSNPVIVRLTNGTAFIDPTDMLDRAARLVGKVYGSQDVLQQRATTKELIVQISHQGAEKDPTQTRALTNSDVVTVEQSDETKHKATVTQASADRTISDIVHDGTIVDLTHTFAAAGSWEAHTVTADKKVRVLFLSLELSADVDLGFRFTSTGTVYYLRTSAGPYVANLLGATVLGGTDEDLFFYASAACTIKGYAVVEEV